MNKYSSIVFGAVVTLLGVWAFIGWWYDLVAVIKGLLPFVLIFTGVVAIVAGITEIKEETSAKKAK